MLLQNPFVSGLIQHLTLANGDQAGISGWVWFVIFLALVFLVAWLLISATRYSGEELSHGEHGEHDAHAEHGHDEHAAAHEAAPEAAHHGEPEPEPEPEPAPEPEPEPAPAPEPEPEPEPAPAPEPAPPAMPEPEVYKQPAAAEVAPAKPDDLTKLEGIGPKVKALLKEHGITTFAQLAATDVSRLSEILDAAKLQMMDPATWPEQARLLAAGDLDGFKALTDKLKGGREA